MARRRITVDERRQRRAAVSDPDTVMEAAAALLATRQRSVAETRRRLRHLGYQHALVEDVLQRLVDMGYLDDEVFARTWVESRDRARPRGEGALRRELELKGVAADTVSAVLEERSERADSDGADADAARRLLDRRRATFEREQNVFRRRQKAYALLARNGFDPEICREVSASFVDLSDGRA